MLSKFMYNGNLILPPKSDVVFKAIFGNEQNKYLLAAFLNDVLDINIADSNSLELISPEFPSLDAEGKSSQLDIRVKLTNGEQINVEIQLRNLLNTIPRSMTYNSRMFISQLTRGMNYGDMRRSVSLLILDFNLFTDDETWYNQYRFKNLKTGRELSDLMEIIFLEMPKMMQECHDMKQLTKREQWALFLSTSNGEVLNMLTEKDKNIGEAVEKLVHVSADERLRFEYEMREKAEFDYYSGSRLVEEAIKEKALAEGLSQGLTEGLAQGLTEGKKQQALETATAMKAKGMDDDLISELTGISPDTLRELQ